jgi:hypothetical protein
MKQFHQSMSLVLALASATAGPAAVQTPNAHGMPQPPAETTVWGAPTNGLRAGIHLVEDGSGRLSDRVRVGDKLRSVCVVQNVSEQAITFTTSSPRFQCPTIHDDGGRLVSMSTPEYDMPVQPVSHTLVPGESLDFGLLPCLFAPHPAALFDQTDRSTAHVLVAEGKYELSCVLELSRQKPDDWSGRLATGQLEVEILPPDRAKLTEHAASVLRKGADHFDLRLVYFGDEKPRLRSLRLNHDSIMESFPAHWTSVEIDRQQVEAIIDHLAKEGFLWRIVAEKLDEQKPKYFLGINLGNELGSKDPGQRLRGYHVSLGWTPSVREKLQRLQKILDGPAATALGQLIAQPELQPAAEDAPAKAL